MVFIPESEDDIEKLKPEDEKMVDEWLQSANSLSASLQEVWTLLESAQSDPSDTRTLLDSGASTVQ